jgi:hypothetical protein
LAGSGPWPGGALVAVALAVVLAAASRAPAQPAEEAILPIEGYAARDARELAAAYSDELRALEAELRRCASGLDVHQHGIAFRRPRGGPAAPYLTLWVWLTRAHSLRGADLHARASLAFGSYGQALFRRLLARSPVFADPRVGGYGIILTWPKPAPMGGGRLVTESLAVFADKLAVANFAHDTIPASRFVTRADVRAFDGQTELASPRLGLEDDAPAAASAC